MKKVNANHLLDYFPQVALPVTINESSRMTFSQQNRPLPVEIIQYIESRFEGDRSEEFTEYIPGFRLEESDEYKLFLYWKGALKTYEYVLVSLNKKGELISRKVIAGTKWEDDTVVQSVAKIDEDLIIHIMVGAQQDGAKYDADQSKAMSMEVLSTGDIIFALDDAALN